MAMWYCAYFGSIVTMDVTFYMNYQYFISFKGTHSTRISLKYEISILFHKNVVSNNGKATVLKFLITIYTNIKLSDIVVLEYKTG